MDADLRRIVIVDAHRRRSGAVARRVHSLGTGETFQFEPAPDGFRDITSGMLVRIDGNRILLPDGRGPINLSLVGDVGFDGVVLDDKEPFSGRAGGGNSVTLYDRHGKDYFQFAVVTDDGPVQ